MPIVIGVTVKLPALKPELIIAAVPGQTPEADVDTVEEGKGYTPILFTVVKSAQPRALTVNLKSDVLTIVVLVGLAVEDDKATPAVKDSQSIDADEFKGAACKDKPPPTPQKTSSEETI